MYDPPEKDGAQKLALTPDQIEAALRKPLPGLTAQTRMAPIPDSLTRPPLQRHPRQGGVLLLLYPYTQGGELFLVLTRRTDTVADHKGQVSLPGGGLEPHDSSLIQTALRETCEELGLCSDEVRILGALTPLYVPPSDFCIHPYVAYLAHRPLFVPQPREVAELLEVPLRNFLGEENIRVEERIIRGGSFQVPYFDACGHKVWGATAIVISEFAAVVARVIP
ncbi:MAG: putative NUDIX hydrolase [Syntrophorhabdus sp. PtaU1.Bin153]|nr:MAG: putative NUDIX hydrolase [Syntrophorhabdus sp. PtaU1.Bin153]